MTLPIWITDAGLILSTLEGETVSINLATNNGYPIDKFYFLSGALPPGLTFSESGLISGTIPLLKVNKTYVFTVRTYNSSGFSDRTFSIQVTDYTTIWNTPANLGIVATKSYFSILLTATDPGASGIEYSLLSGELPDGLQLTKNGLLSGYISDITPTVKTFTFTVRALGSIAADRTFTITISAFADKILQWNTIGSYNIGNGIEGGNIGNVFTGIAYSFQLKSVIPFNSSATTTTYTLINGTLPPGLTITSTGLISGNLTTQAIGIFPITVNVTDGINNVTRIFYFRTNFTEQQLIYWVVPKHTLLDYYNISDLASDESDSFNINETSFEVYKFDNAIELDEKLVNTLVYTRKLDITAFYLIIQNSSGNYTIYDFYTGNKFYQYSLQSITPTPFLFSLGNIEHTEKSFLGVQTVTLDFWTRYSLASGTLPPGTWLNGVSGNIEGTISNPSASTYSFSIKAYNYSVETFLDFTVTISENTAVYDNSVYIDVTGDTLLKIIGYNDLNILSQKNIYREGDRNYGVQAYNNQIRIPLLPNVKDTDDNSLINICDFNIPTSLHPDTFESHPVVNSSGNYIADAVILRFKDIYKSADSSYVIPAVKNSASVSDKQIKISTLDSIRKQFIDTTYASETFENWMHHSVTTDISSHSFITTTQYHKFITGDSIRFESQTLPNPFQNNVTYYVIVVDAYTFRLAASKTNALNGVYIEFNSNEITNYSIFLKTFIPGIVICYFKPTYGNDEVTKMVNKQNITPYGFYTLNPISENLTTVFFKTLYGHNLNTGDKIKLVLDKEAVTSLFKNDKFYYVIKQTSTTFLLAETYDDAVNLSPITIQSYYNIYNKNERISGVFKKPLTGNNETIIVLEADTDFYIPVNYITYKTKNTYSAYSISTATNIITITDHGLDTGDSIIFKHQINVGNIQNDIPYYCNVIDNNSIKLFLSEQDAINNQNPVIFSQNGNGYVLLPKTPKFVLLNQKRNHIAVGDKTSHIIVSSQTSFLATGDEIIFKPSKTSLPSEILINTVYYVIAITPASFRIASSLINATNGIYIPFTSNFEGEVIINNETEWNWNRNW